MPESFMNNIFPLPSGIVH